LVLDSAQQLGDLRVRNIVLDKNDAVDDEIDTNAERLRLWHI
jgi:hypothetical protein